MSTLKKMLYVTVGLAVILVGGGALLVSLLEHVAGAATYLGAFDPVAAWATAGLLLGAFLGFLFGRYRMGKPPKLYGAGLVGVLLVGGAALVTVNNGLATRSAPNPSPSTPQVMFSSWITATSGLNIRHAASPRAQIVTTIPCGEEVRVIAERRSQGRRWLQVLGENDRPLGYVASNFTRKTTAGRRPSCGIAPDRPPQGEPSGKDEQTDPQQTSPTESTSRGTTGSISTHQEAERRTGGETESSTDEPMSPRNSVSENPEPSGSTQKETASKSRSEQSETFREGAESNDVFVVVEKFPRLIGGLARLQKEVEYPTFARDAGIEGRVFVQFVVDENGDTQNVTVTRGVHRLLNEEAVRVVREMKFVPGEQNGGAVKVQMSLPVTFRLK